MPNLVIITKSKIPNSPVVVARELDWETDSPDHCWLDVNMMGVYLPQMYLRSEFEPLEDAHLAQYDLCLTCSGYGALNDRRCNTCLGSGSTLFTIEIQENESSGMTSGKLHLTDLGKQRAAEGKLNTTPRSSS